MYQTFKVRLGLHSASTYNTLESEKEEEEKLKDKSSASFVSLKKEKNDLKEIINILTLKLIDENKELMNLPNTDIATIDLLKRSIAKYEKN